jgi:hypothetical protein
VELLSRGSPTLGTLHLTAHHLIFSSNVTEGEKPREMWICYPIIHTVERRQPLSLGVEGCALRFRCRDFNFFTLGFRNEAEGKDVFESVAKLTCVGRPSTDRVLMKVQQINYTRLCMNLARLRRRSILGGCINLRKSLREWG